MSTPIALLPRDTPGMPFAKLADSAAPNCDAVLPYLRHLHQRIRACRPGVAFPGLVFDESLARPTLLLDHRGPVPKPLLQQDGATIRFSGDLVRTSYMPLIVVSFGHIYAVTKEGRVFADHTCCEIHPRQPYDWPSFIRVLEREFANLAPTGCEPFTRSDFPDTWFQPVTRLPAQLVVVHQYKRTADRRKYVHTRICRAFSEQGEELVCPQVSGLLPFRTDWEPMPLLSPSDIVPEETLGTHVHCSCTGTGVMCDDCCRDL